MAVLEFTSYEDIRAALGVSADELDDTTISLPLYEFNLLAELRSISSTLISDFRALSPDPSQRTDDENAFAQAVLLFATYAVAKQLTAALPLFSPKEISDGKAHQTRYAQDPYKATIDAILGQYEQFKENLVDAYGAVKSVPASATVFRTYAAGAAPSVDPVTGS